MTIKSENRRVKVTFTPEETERLEYIKSHTSESVSEAVCRLINAEYELLKRGFITTDKKASIKKGK